MKKLLALITILALSLTVACKSSPPDDGTNGEKTNNGQQTAQPTEAPLPEWLLKYPDDVPSHYDDVSTLESYDHGAGIDQNGYWEMLTALDVVEGLKYKGLEVPREIHKIDADDAVYQLNRFIQRDEFVPEPLRITDREIADQDLVNIDFAGSVGGVAFEGGTDTDRLVTAGSGAFIDDFLTQIIGAKPGDTVNVNVTFPEAYEQSPDLAGKAAVFVVEINFIVDMDKLQQHVNDELRKSKIFDYLVSQTTVDVPDEFISFIEERMLEDMRNTAKIYDELFSDYVYYLLMDFITDLKGIRGVISVFRNENMEIAHARIVFQAIAEDMGMIITDKDVDDYLASRGVEDRTESQEFYGLPFIKQATMHYMLKNYVAENAVLL